MLLQGSLVTHIYAHGQEVGWYENNGVSSLATIVISTNPPDQKSMLFRFGTNWMSKTVKTL